MVHLIKGISPVRLGRAFGWIILAILCTYFLNRLGTMRGIERLVKTIAAFDDFCHANDPHEEHDFGAFDVDGHRIFFKIDYYDKTLTCHSPDPADPTVTERVITIMLAEEY